MKKRSTLILKVVIGGAVLFALWLILARVLWYAWPYLSVNSNPSLSVPCAEGMFNCTLDAKRTFWNFNTDWKGWMVNHVLSALIIGLISFVVTAYFADRKQTQRMANSFHRQ